MALENKVAGPFQEADLMVLEKFHIGQRHLRSSTSKFVENPRRRKLGKVLQLHIFASEKQNALHKYI